MLMSQDYASRLAQMRQKGRPGGGNPQKKSSTPIKQQQQQDSAVDGQGC